jgi:hypothetical protein
VPPADEKSDRPPEVLDEPPIIEQPELTEADIRRVQGLAEKYGWHHLIDRGDEPPPG